MYVIAVSVMYMCNINTIYNICVTLTAWKTVMSMTLLPYGAASAYTYCQQHQDFMCAILTIPVWCLIVDCYTGGNDRASQQTNAIGKAVAYTLQHSCADA